MAVPVPELLAPGENVSVLVIEVVDEAEVDLLEVAVEEEQGLVLGEKDEDGAGREERVEVLLDFSVTEAIKLEL